MSWFSTLVIDIEKPFHAVAAFFQSHRYAIQSGLTAAEVAATDLNKVAAAVGVSGPPAAELAKVADALKDVNYAITTGANAETLTAQVAVLSGLTTALVKSGDIHVKNPALVAQIGVVLAKVQAATPIIQAAIEADPAVIGAGK